VEGLNPRTEYPCGAKYYRMTNGCLMNLLIFLLVKSHRLSNEYALLFVLIKLVKIQAARTNIIGSGFIQRNVVFPVNNILLYIVDRSPWTKQPNKSCSVATCF